MLDRPNDYLKKKAEQLGIDRVDKLAEIQKFLDEKYPGMCRAASLNDGVLKIVVSNSSVASEIRYGQAEIKRLHKYVERIIVGV